MHLQIKLVAAAFAWSGALACALAATVLSEHELALWAILSGQLGVTFSCWLAFDIVVERVSKRAVDLIQASDAKAAERTAGKITDALREGGTVSSLR